MGINRQVLVTLPIILFSYFLSAQNVGINSSGSAPNSSAALDLDFTNKGFLPPRMTATQRDAIASPATSLIIFNTTDNCLQTYISGKWQNVVCDCMLPGIFAASNATGVTSTEMDANWTASTGATAYYLDVDDNSDFSSPLVGYDNLNVGNVTTYNITGLTCATTYYYRLRAENSCGTTGNSNTITTSTSSCCAPDFVEDFSSYANQTAADAAWPTTNTATYRVNVTNDNLSINSFLSSTITTISYDLGAGNVSDTQWLLRMTVNTSNWTCYSAGNWAVHPFFGISDRDYNSGANYQGPNQDFIGSAKGTNPCNGYGVNVSDNSCCITNNGSPTLSLAPSGTQYLEIVRLSATSVRVTVYSDASFTTVLATQTHNSVASTIQNLRYIKFGDDGGPLFISGSGQWQGTIDDITFWNNRTTPCP